MRLVTRTEAAEIAGVEPRTVTRWAARGRMTKYENARGQVRFDPAEAERMRDPDAGAAPERETVTATLKRW